MSAVTLTLPFPPSVNALTRNVPGVGRVKTARYKAWITEAGWEARRQHAGKVLGPYALTIIAKRPDARRRDLGNLEKAISDLLVSLGIIEDDYLAQRIEKLWSGVGKTVQVSVLSTKVAA
jgi:crossover junction endodeoxyribonuclease RusA